jgi:hypothetical protein
MVWRFDHIDNLSVAFPASRLGNLPVVLLNSEWVRELTSRESK